MNNKKSLFKRELISNCTTSLQIGLSRGTLYVYTARMCVAYVLAYVYTILSLC